MPPRKPAKRAAAGAPAANANANANANILSFFKPVSHSQPQTPPPPASSSSRLPALSSPSPSPPLGRRSRSATGTPARRRLQSREIAASDDSQDDGSSSDGSFEDLSVLLGRGKTRAVPAQGRLPQLDPYATPRAKRTAVEFLSSPLAIIPKHKFDIKALAKDARKDHATTASSLAAKAAAEQAKLRAAASAGAEPSGDAVAHIVKENGGHDAQKVMRAVQRSDPGQSQLRYCFFDPEPPAPSPRPVPREGNVAPWRLLTQGTIKHREQNLMSGLPQAILRRANYMPDPFFHWVLDELCTQQSAIMRHEYRIMVSDCTRQVKRLVTPERLRDMLWRLGAAKHPLGGGRELPVSKPVHEPYEHRDWSCLRSFLELLVALSRHLSIYATAWAAHALIRMSMDRFLICNIDILTAYEDAMRSLLNAIPTSSWDAFCYATCSSLSSAFRAQSIRVNALLCLPVSDRRTHDLRRRLAVVFLLGDDALGRHSPEDVVSVRSIIDFLDGDSFVITPRTDFSELKAGILLLDMAVDDGTVVTFDGREDEKRFNDDVDELASKLGDIWRRINDSGMKLARTEAKGVVEWVQQRLLNTVRTKKKARKSVFDLPGEADVMALPRQQDYMKRLFRK